MRKLRASRVTAVVLGSAMFASLAQAHHSAAMYDDHRTVTLNGVVTRFVWGNPHVYIYVAQSGAAQKVEWEIEGSPPSILRRLGWSTTTLHTGDLITVAGRPAKDPNRKALLPMSIRLGDKVLFDRNGEIGRLSTYTEAASTSAHGIEGVWTTLLDVNVEDLLDEDKLPLTPEGRRAHQQFDERTMHPGAHCVPYSAPTFMVTPDLKRIQIRRSLVLIDGEFDAAQRTVHLETVTHDGASPSNQGHSIGHWEGRSLVIDTTQFAASPVGNAYGVPSGVRKHLIERLTPATDGKSLTYHFELSDPQFIATTVKGDVRWVFSPAAQYAPDKCDPQNAKHYTQPSTSTPVSALP